MIFPRSALPQFQGYLMQDDVKENRRISGDLPSLAVDVRSVAGRVDGDNPTYLPWRA
jgi:hypothetical protein